MAVHSGGAMRRRGWRGLAVVVMAVLTATLVPSAAGAVTPSPGRDRCLVGEAFEVFLDRAPSQSEVDRWAQRFSQGTGREELPQELANSSEWLEVEVTKLYQDALNRGPDSSGLNYWVGELRGGALVNRIGAQIYGSAEFYANAGGSDAAFVRDLFTRILARPADQGGLDYWVGEIAQRGRGSVAAQFFGSVESRTGRVSDLYQRLLGRGPDAAGRRYWANRLRAINDVRLAVQLASSSEFYSIAQRGCESAPATYLTELDYVEEYGPWDWEWITMNAQDFPRSMTQDSGEFCDSGNLVDYNLGRGFRRLVATVGIGDDAEDTGAEFVYRVILDGRVVHTDKATFGTLRNLDISVAGALRLRIEVDENNPNDDGCDATLGFGNIRLRG